MRILPLFPIKRKTIPTINTIVLETEQGCISIIDKESSGLRITAGNAYQSKKEEYFLQIYDHHDNLIGLYDEIKLELGFH